MASVNVHLHSAVIISYTDDELPDDIYFKNVMIIMACVIKDDDQFHPQLFLEEGLFC